MKNKYEQYGEYIQDLDLSKSNIADYIGVTARTLDNYLNENTSMPFIKELLLVNYLNNQITIKQSNYNKITAIPIDNGYGQNTLSISVDELNDIADSIHKIEEIENKYNLNLFDDINDDSFIIVKLAQSNSNYKDFIKALTNLLKEKKSLHYKCSEIDKQYFNSLKIDNNNAYKEFSKFLRVKDKYTPELNTQIKNNDFAIKQLCQDFLEQLILDYIDSDM